MSFRLNNEDYLQLSPVVLRQRLDHQFHKEKLRDFIGVITLTSVTPVTSENFVILEGPMVLRGAGKKQNRNPPKTEGRANAGQSQEKQGFLKHWCRHL